jgi:SulP family sulfate permease
MSGVGLIIVLLQIFPFVGLPAQKSTLKVIQNLPELAGANFYAVLLGIITIIVYYLFPRITKAIPAALVALISATLIAYFAGWDVPVIGEIPSGLPSLRLNTILGADWSALGMIVEYGLVLAVLGSIDSLLTSVIADNMTKTKHNSNRELIGQGIGNMLAAVIGGIPGAGATKGTVVNINAGGRTRISGAIHGLFLLAVLLGLGSLAAHIPLSVLAGLLIPIGFKIIDFRGLKHLTKVPRADAVVLVIVLLITTFGSLINAVGIGVALAALLFMKRSADLGEQGLEVGSVSELGEQGPWRDEMAFYDKYKDSVIIKHLYGPLFFGFTSYFKDQIAALPDSIRAVIFRMDRVPHIDQSGVYALEEVVFDLRQNGTEVIFVGLQEQPCDQLEAIDMIPDLVPREDLFKTVDEAFAYLREKLRVEA